MGTSIRWFMGLFAATLLSLPVSDASAGPASDTLQARQDDLYDLLRQAHRNPRKIQSALDGLLDLPAMCAASLGGHAAFLSEADKARYIGLCKRLVSRAYASSLMATRNHDVRIVSERAGDQTVTVDTLVVSRERPNGTPEERTYVMVQRDGAWKVADILIGGRSLVQSQRIAHARIIARNGFQVLVRKLEYLVASEGDPF